MSDDVTGELVAENTNDLVDNPLTAEEQAVRVLMQMTTLYNSATARLMLMFMNETLMRPWIGAEKDEVWCMPDHTAFMRMLGLKKKQSLLYFKMIDTLSNDGWLLKSKTLDKKPKMIYWVNYERLEELINLSRYVKPLAGNFNEEDVIQKFKEERERLLKEQENEDAVKDSSVVG